MGLLAAWIATTVLTTTPAGQLGPAPQVAFVAPPLEVVPVPRPSLPPPVHPLRVRWGITAPVLATTGLGFALMEQVGANGAAPRRCVLDTDPGCPELGLLEPLDRVALGHVNDGATTASDVMVGVALLLPVALSIVESATWARAEPVGTRRRGRGAARFGVHTAIWAESMGVAMFTTGVVKSAFDRPRPLSHLGDDAQLEARGIEVDGDLGRSFPSGHATLAFSSVVAGATLFTLQRCRPSASRWRSGVHRCAEWSRRDKTMLGLVWGLGLATAATTATLRVVAGKHYPSDVLMGAAIGAASGVVIPLLHRRREQD